MAKEKNSSDQSAPRKTAAKKSPIKKAAAPKAAFSKAAAAGVSTAAAESAPASSGAPAPRFEATGFQPPPAALYEEIRLRAYEFYCERGGQHGSHEADWHRAELEVRSKYK
jgi:hypothetical protein